jgi:hypothetical protein
MSIYHIIAVSPVNKGPNELHAVKLLDYMVVGKSLTDAWEKIAIYVLIEAAFEVWGSKMSHDVIIDPNSRLNNEATIADHNHWKSVQTSYRQLKQGEKTLGQWSDEQFAAYHEQKTRKAPLAASA